MDLDNIPSNITNDHIFQAISNIRNGEVKISDYDSWGKVFVYDKGVFFNAEEVVSEANKVANGTEYRQHYLKYYLDCADFLLSRGFDVRHFTMEMKGYRPWFRIDLKLRKLKGSITTFSEGKEKGTVYGKERSEDGGILYVIEDSKKLYTLSKNTIEQAWRDVRNDVPIDEDWFRKTNQEEFESNPLSLRFLLFILSEIHPTNMCWKNFTR
ncbi:hypothetical protein ACF3N7_09975 [Cruoricaptor ignavus]|uniref:hypothetical protein n=1 Tax=Cruoricaptor ignavus TaxID=1118202 RepID=UPI00370DDC0F